MSWIIPTWCKTVGNMRDMSKPGEVLAYCSKCRQYKDVDPGKIAAIKGDDYSLVDRTPRCSATPGCEGRMSFHVKHGVMRPLRNY